MCDIVVIGSDSFIATQFILNNNNKGSMKLFSRINSGKSSEIIFKDLFKITSRDFDNCETVVNFAAIVHNPSLNDDTLYDKVNAKLPVYLANEAKNAGVKHFIQLSTIAVYGGETTINEKTPEIPNNIYGKSKLAADHILLSMQDNDFKVSVVRPPMVYGSGNSPGNMMKLINAAQRGFPMPFKDIKNERDFINVRNLALALKTVIEKKIYGIIIPTDKKPVSTEEIINLVKKYAKSKVRLIKVPIFILSLIRKIKPKIYIKVFGSLKVICNIPDVLYKPSFTLEDGIKEMVNINKQ